MLVVLLFNLNRILTFFSFEGVAEKKVPVDGFMGILGLPSQRYEQGHPGGKKPVLGAWYRTKVVVWGFST